MSSRSHAGHDQPLHCPVPGGSIVGTPVHLKDSAHDFQVSELCALADSLTATIDHEGRMIEIGVARGMTTVFQITHRDVLRDNGNDENVFRRHMDLYHPTVHALEVTNTALEDGGYGFVDDVSPGTACGGAAQVYLEFTEKIEHQLQYVGGRSGVIRKLLAPSA